MDLNIRASIHFDHYARTRLNTLSKLLTDEPVGLTASSASLFHSISLFFSSFPVSHSSNSLTRSCPSSHCPTLLLDRPSIQHRRTSCLSAGPSGSANRSSAPQCSGSRTSSSTRSASRTPPNDGWFRTFSCGHHPERKLRSFVSSMNPGGRIAVSPFTRSDRRTQRNGCLCWASLAVG